MTPILEDAALGSDLDCQNFNLRNVRALYPVPPGLVDDKDPVLYDPRVPPIASVTNESVSPVAGITQGKLSLNGVIPAPWLGTASGQAARGDLVELASRKGAPNGYVALDSGGKLPPSNILSTASLGTVNTVGLAMPPELDVTGSPITSTGSFNVPWKNVPDQSWFGVHGVGLDAVLKPSFRVDQIPLELASAISAAKFTSGVFASERMPVAVFGTGHATGAVPDPGEFGLESDYLGRDMLWHTFAPEVLTQPTCPMPTITLDSWSDTEVLVTVRSPLPGSSMFIRINTGPWHQSKIEHHNKLFPDVHDTISVQDGDVVWAYAAKSGYNNSDFVGGTNPWKVKTPLTILYP
jgi:hypothetical protein